MAYLVHDAHTSDDRRPTTSERVGFTHVENLPECDARTAGRIMRGTARDADDLKRLAGVSTRGRKLDRPVYHYSLSWAPGERPSQADQVTAARASLQALGLQDRQALIVQHTDRVHPHVHVVVNRVSAEDGRAASVSHDRRALSRWARTWEREHGGIRCQRRRAPAVDRAIDTVTRVVKREPPPPDLPPAPRRRGPGRERRTPAERRGWAALYERERNVGRQLPDQRWELARAQREARELEREREPAPPRQEPRRFVYQTAAGRVAAEAVESRLPHVAGVLAVSDRTFDKLEATAHRSYYADDERAALAGVRDRHRGDAAERQRAEEEYHRSDVDREHHRRRQARTSAWRGGQVDTPAPAPRREAIEAVIHRAVERLWSAIQSVCHEVRDRLRKERRRERQREQQRGPDHESGRSR